MGKNEGLIYTYSVDFFEGSGSAGKFTLFKLVDLLESPEESKQSSLEKMSWQPVELETY